MMATGSPHPRIPESTLSNDRSTGARHGAGLLFVTVIDVGAETELPWLHGKTVCC